MTSENSRLENQILHFSKLKKWDKVEALWPQIIENPPDKPKFYSALASSMIKQEKKEDLRAWIMLLIEACQENGEHRILIQAARGVLCHLPEFEDLRAPLVTALKARYAKFDRVDEYVEISGLDVEENLNKALKRFLQFTKCSEGEVFQHPEWGEGLVTKLDLEADRVHFDFTRGGEKSFSFAGVNDYLKKIPKTHLFAQRLLNPKRLLRRAEEDPVEFIKFCLKSLDGRATRGELKDHLTIGVFDTRSWNNWWGKSRDLFRFDPYIGFSGTAANVRLELRKEPKSFHEEMLRDFLNAESFAKEYSLLNDLIKIRDREPVPEENARQIIQVLESRFRKCDPAENEAARIEYLYLLEDMSQALGVPSALLDETGAGALLGASATPVETIAALTAPENQLRAAKGLKAARPDRWNEYAEEFFLSAPTRLGQWVLRDAIEERNLDAASHIAEQLLHRPYENPEIFLWLARALRDGKLPELHVDVPSDILFSVVIEQIEDCFKRISRDDPEASAFRTVINRFQNFLMDNHYALVIEVFENYEQDEARARYQSLMDSPALSEGFKVALDQILRSFRRDLDAEGAGDAVGGEHLVTAKSFQERQAEYMHIKNEEIPANSQAIGVAAAMGDLSENAEYESAKERQKVLFRRLEALESLLQRARVLEPDQIRTDEIGFGVSFQIKNMDSGEIETYSLLGIWDAEPEKNILSYMTPFGKQFLKRKVGDVLVVVRPGGGSIQYKVLKITNALSGE